MKAAVFKEKGLLAVEEIPTPEPGPEEVLCRVKYCGICGTDLNNYSFNIPAPWVYIRTRMVHFTLIGLLNTRTARLVCLIPSRELRLKPQNQRQKASMNI